MTYNIKYNLHLHSCLSPCGSDDMTPRNIINMCALCGYEAVALTDHNSAANCPAAAEAAMEAGLLFLPGLELTTAEEVHVLCFLPDLKAAADFSEYVYSKLPDIPNKPHIFGTQVIVDENDKAAGEERRFLLTATEISIYEVPGLLKAYGGAAVPAHVDKGSFSVISNLGGWDTLWGFKAYEQYNRDSDVAARYPGMSGLYKLFNSDAHRLEDMRDAENVMELQTMSAKSIIKQLSIDS
jgi:hypothetical protein